MADPYKSVRQDVLREQIKKAIDIHSHYAMLTSFSVILVLIDTALSILSHTQLFIKTRNAVFKFRHNRACLVYV